MTTQGVRRPWGVSPWLFWVALLVGAGLVGNIPYVGIPLMLAILIGGGVVRFRTPPSGAARPADHSAARAGAALPARWGEIEVQGESFRRDAVRRLFDELGLAAGGVIHLTATLEAEPTNKYDRNAVKVVVRGWHIGYVPAEISADVATSLRRVRSPAQAPVRIWADPRDGLWRARATLFPAQIEKNRDFAAESQPVARTAARSRARQLTVAVSETLDLRSVESVRMRVKGVGHYIDDDERLTIGGPQNLLVREPDNPHDSNAVRVTTLEGRMIGHVSAARAKIIAPMLDELGPYGFIVGGKSASAEENSFAVDIPRAEALRRFVKLRQGDRPRPAVLE